MVKWLNEPGFVPGLAILELLPAVINLRLGRRGLLLGLGLGIRKRLDAGIVFGLLLVQLVAPVGKLCRSASKLRFGGGELAPCGVERVLAGGELIP